MEADVLAALLAVEAEDVLWRGQNRSASEGALALLPRVPGGLESRNVSHVGLPVARQEQLEGKESLFPSRCGAECGSGFVGLGLDLGSVVSAITRKLEL